MRFEIKWRHAVMVDEEYVLEIDASKISDDDIIAAGYDSLAEWVDYEPHSWIDCAALVSREEDGCIGDYDTFEVKEINLLEQIAEATKPDSD